jgi:hypothetical protein
MSLGTRDRTNEKKKLMRRKKQINNADIKINMLSAIPTVPSHPQRCGKVLKYSI